MTENVVTLSGDRLTDCLTWLTDESIALAADPSELPDDG